MQRTVRTPRLSSQRLESMKRLSIAFFTKTGQGPIRISCRCSMLLGTNLYFIKPRQQAQEELVPLTPLMMRTNGTDLVVREALEGELLLVLLGLEAIALAWPGSEATRTPDGRR